MNSPHIFKISNYLERLVLKFCVLKKIVMNENFPWDLFFPTNSDVYKESLFSPISINTETSSPEIYAYLRNLSFSIVVFHLKNN